MQAVLEVVCGGHRCTARGRWVAVTRNQAYTASKEAGWRATTVNGEMVDLCRACAADFLPGLKCADPKPCGFEIADLIGHDQDGHRIARYLWRRWGVNRVRQVMDWEEEGTLGLLPTGTHKRLLQALKS